MMTQAERPFAVTLVSPPLWAAVQGPALALPMLSGLLREHGIRVRQRDLNIETIGSDAFLSEACTRLEEEFDDLNSREGLSDPERVRYRHLHEVMSLLYLVVGDDSTASQRQRFLGTLFHPLLEILSDLPALDHMVREDSRNPFRSFLKKEILPGLTAEPTDLLGISVACPQQFIAALTLAMLFRERAPSVPILLGGSLLCLQDESMLHGVLKLPYVDYVIRYEGGRPLLALVDALGDGKPLESVPNLSWSEKDELRQNEIAEPLHPDACPDPEFDDLLEQPYARPVKVPVLQSRGCYWGRCSFCDIHMYIGGKKRYLQRSPDLLAGLVDRLSKRYGVDCFEIVSTAMSPAYARKFSEALMGNNVSVQWETRIKVERQFTRSLLNTMAKAGCMQLSIGVESIADRVIRLMDKGNYTRSDVERLLSDVRSAGIEKTKIWLMPNFPTTSRAEADAHLGFLEANAHLLSIVNILPFHVLPHTTIFHEPGRYGLRLNKGHERSLLSLYAVPFETTMGMSRGEGEMFVRDCLRAWEEMSRKNDDAQEDPPVDWFNCCYRVRFEYKTVPVRHPELLQSNIPKKITKVLYLLIVPGQRRTYTVNDTLIPILEALSNSGFCTFDELASAAGRSLNLPEMGAAMMTMEVLNTLKEYSMLEWKSADTAEKK